MSKGLEQDISDLMGGADVSEDSQEGSRVAELEAQVASLMAMFKLGNPALDTPISEEPSSEETETEKVHIHILIDGLMAAGTTWYRGQEIQVSTDSPEFLRQVDRNGNCWMTLTVEEQYEKFGKQVYGQGPWPGKAWGDVSGISDDAIKQEIKKAAAKEQARGGSLPRPVALESAE